MKQILFGGALAAISALVIAAVLMTSGRSVRKNELQRVLDRAAEQAVDHFSGEQKAEGTQELLVEMFLEELLLGIESDSEITVRVMGADPKKGILSVRAEEIFHHPGGRQATVTADKTVILEQYSLPAKNVYTISYYITGRMYKTYYLTEGSSIQVPGLPEEGFLYWRNDKGEKQTAGEVAAVNQNQVWEAVLR